LLAGRLAALVSPAAASSTAAAPAAQ
jgi:hypothetical protein